MIVFHYSSKYKHNFSKFLTVPWKMKTAKLLAVLLSRTFQSFIVHGETEECRGYPGYNKIIPNCLLNLKMPSCILSLRTLTQLYKCIVGVNRITILYGKFALGMEVTQSENLRYWCSINMFYQYNQCIFLLQKCAHVVTNWTLVVIIVYLMMIPFYNS